MGLIGGGRAGMRTSSRTGRQHYRSLPSPSSTHSVDRDDEHGMKANRPAALELGREEGAEHHKTGNARRCDLPVFIKLRTDSVAILAVSATTPRKRARRWVWPLPYTTSPTITFGRRADSEPRRKIRVPTETAFQIRQPDPPLAPSSGQLRPALERVRPGRMGAIICAPRASARAGPGRKSAR